MHRVHIGVLVSAFAIAATTFAFLGDGTRDGLTDAPQSLGPVRGFVENRGQWPAAIAFAAAADGEWLHVVDRGLAFGKGTHRVEVRSRGAGHAMAVGIAPADAVCNFLLGDDPKRHVRAARSFAAVR